MIKANLGILTNFGQIKILVVFICVIGFFFSTNLFGSNINSNGLLSKNLSAANNSLSLGGAALPQGSEFYLENPAQLWWAGYMEYGVHFEYGFLDNIYSSIYGIKKFNKIPVAFNVGMFMPTEIAQIDDDGVETDKFKYSEAFFGAHSAYKLTFNLIDVAFGYGLKGYFNRVINQNFFSVMADASVMFLFQLEFLRIRDINKTSNKNLNVSVSGLNFGMPITYVDKPNQLPSAILTAMNYSVASIPDHAVDWVMSAKNHVFSETAIDDWIFSTGFQYLLYSMIYFRISGELHYDEWNVQSGMGVTYNFKGIFNLQADYNFSITTAFGSQHNLSVKGSYNYDTFQGKIQGKTGHGEGLIKDINFELLEKMREIISDYTLEKGKFPNTLDEILKIFQQKFAFSEPPRAVNGEITYDKDTGSIFVVKKDMGDFKDVVVLKDESKIYCNIEKDLGDQIRVRHQFGIMDLQKSYIKTTYSKVLDTIDNEIVATLQTYIQSFRIQKGVCPASINELKDFLTIYNIERIPTPSVGYIVLEKDNCEIKISRENKMGSVEVEEKKEIKIEETKKDDIFSTEEEKKKEKIETEEKKEDVFEF